MRYTEVRMAPLSTEMLADIARDTVDMVPNYDEKELEPVVLPARIPNLLVNGSMGIAVVYTTNVPPHNLREVCDGLLMFIDNPDVSIDELMTVIPGPDFPTHGLILGTNGIRQAYETGRGQVTMQAQAVIEPMDNGKSAIIVTELPYQVNKARLIEQIADLVKAKKLEGISDLRDESDRAGMRIYIELKRDAHPKRVLNFLYKHTPMRLNFGVIMLALVDSKPRVLNLPKILQHYIDHRRNIIVRRTEYELKKAKARAHILEGLRIALEFLDEVIKIIRASKSTEAARQALIERFSLSTIQANAILEMPLRQLTALERQKIDDEYRELIQKIAYLEEILANPRKVLDIINQEVKEMKQKFGDPRRSRIIQMEAEDIGEEDLIPDEEMIITVTRDGYIKRVPIDTYRSQKRPGRGIMAATTKEEDSIEHMFVATTHHYILFFTNKGRVYRLKAYEVPQTSRQAMGTAIINLISIEPGDSITATVPIKSLDTEGYLVMATEKGEIKRSAVRSFQNMRANGLRAFDLEEGDSLRWVSCTGGNENIIMVTEQGMSIHFSEEELRDAGRGSGGVRGIRLGDSDRVVGMGVTRDDSDLLVISEKGLGKRTPVKEYRPQSRGGKGIQTMNITAKTGKVVDSVVVDKEDRVIVITSNGIALRLRVNEIRETGRSAQGVKLINLAETDSIASIERIVVNNKHDNCA
jgi:DNA gyrase subunit A